MSTGSHVLHPLSLSVTDAGDMSCSRVTVFKLGSQRQSHFSLHCSTKLQISLATQILLTAGIFLVET